MSVIESYRNILQQLRGQQENLEPGGPPGHAQLEISDDQVQIANILNQESLINLFLIRTSQELFQAGAALNDGNTHLIEFEIHPAVFEDDPSYQSSVNGRLEALDDFEAEHPEWLGATEDDQTVRLAHSNDFVSYGSGFITYKGAFIKFTPNEIKVFDELLYNANNSVPLDELWSKLGKDYNESSVRDDFSKIITPLNQKLEEIVGYKPIDSLDRRTSWVLNFKEPS
tara:strand:- start:2442 stop:3122 length:681 start_codon:yes stop_codon:yes gene_type:complete